MKETAGEGEKTTQFFSYERRVEGGFRVSSVSVGHDIKGPGPSRFGDDAKVCSIEGYTTRRSMAQSPMQAYRDLKWGVSAVLVLLQNTHWDTIISIGSPLPE